MPWHRKKKSQEIQIGHFIDPGVTCMTCGEEADAVVVYDKVSADYYCKFCLIVITSEWSIEDVE